MIETLQQANSNIPETLEQLTVAELFKLSQESYRSPEHVQALLLKQILEWAKDSEFGKKHRFGEITSIEDFQRMVPIAEWADVEPFTDLMADGEADVLVPGKPNAFIVTSGTTGNKPKLIPETVPGAIARNLVMKLRMIALNFVSPGILGKGCIFPLSNILPDKKTAGGIPLSYASGFTLNQSMGGQQAFKVAFPFALLMVQEPSVRDYLLMRFAIQKPDVVLIAGNNVGRFTELIRFANMHSESIIKDIENGTVEGAGIVDPALMEKLGPTLFADPERAAVLRKIKDSEGEILPRHYWPSMEIMAFWLSSSVGHYINDVKPLMPQTCKYLDMGYGASEGKFNVPFEANNPAGTLSILTSFYEFIPEAGGKPLLAHQLEDQKNYELLITTWGGLYRYNLKDVVKVEGFTGKTPNIVFQYKSGEILNIAEEKIPAIEVSNALIDIAEKMGVKLLQVQIFPSEAERRYICYIEPENDEIKLDTNELSIRLHNYLGENFLIYNLLVTQQKLLNAPGVFRMKTGWQRHLYKIKTLAGQSTTQIKLPVMIKVEADNNWILKP